MDQDSDARTGAVGLPSPQSIVSEIEFTPSRPASPGTAGSPAASRIYTILRTTETDGYEDDLAESEVPAFGIPAPGPPGDNFGGTARKRAKTGLESAPEEHFADLTDLIGTVTAHATMKALDISTSANSGRVAQERRNVRVATFLYAASREEDNDFHLIIGRAPGATPPLFMTVEISGLPPSSHADHARLRSARDSYKGFFGADLPGKSYDFYNPPIPVEISGSLFWDASHATGSKPGPSSLRPHMPVVWEIHPISAIDFEP